MKLATLPLILLAAALFGSDVARGPLPINPDEFAAYVIAGHSAADASGDGVVDGRDIQSYVAEAIGDEKMRIQNHPLYPELLASLKRYMEWPESKWSESPERMLGTIAVCAQLEYFTGEWPKPDVTIPILRRVRDEWPLPFENFEHSLTLNHIPAMYWAAKLSPKKRMYLIYPLRWCEWRMMEPEPPGRPSGAIYSTNIGPGLRDMVMIREILYGSTDAARTAWDGYCHDPTQWGLQNILDTCIDETGMQRNDPAGFNHVAWTMRPALAWLMRRPGVAQRLNAEQREKWDKFYALPCRLLCVGGKSFTIPGVNDEYGSNPVVGPYASWTGDTAMDRWARARAVEQGQPISLEWLMVPATRDGSAQRPPECSGNREFGRVKIEETLDKSTIYYLGDGEPIHGGHNKAGPCTVEVGR